MDPGHEEMDRSASGDDFQAVMTELRVCDPSRFKELVRLARRIVEVRRDPVRAMQEQLGLAWRAKNLPKA